jgi:hypothetical protein
VTKEKKHNRKDNIKSMKTYKMLIATVAGAMVGSAAHATLSDLGSITDNSTLGTAYVGNYGPVNDPFSNPATTLQGTLSSWVLTSDPNDPAGYTGDTYVYRVNETPGTDIVGALSLNGFASVGNIAVGFVSQGAPFDPTSISQAANGVINVAWSTGFTGLGDFIFVYTSVRGAALVTDPVQDGVNSSAVALAPVPEPTTAVAAALMMLPLCVGAVRALRK